MARRGRPTKYVLTVLPEQRAELLRLSRQRTNRALGFRSKIILKSASGMSNSDVAGQLKTTAFTVGYWRKRFVQAGVDGLVDEPRPGAPRQISDAQVAHVISVTLEQTPKDATHWSTRSLAKHLGLSQTMVSRIWRAFGLQPHRNHVQNTMGWNRA